MRPRKPAFNGVSAQVARDQANSNNKSYDPRKKTVILGGDNNQVVKDRNAARQANMDAAEALKAELMGGAEKKEEDADAAEPPVKKVKTESGAEASAITAESKRRRRCQASSSC